MKTVVSMPSATAQVEQPQGSDSEAAATMNNDGPAQPERGHRSRSQARTTPAESGPHSPFVPLLLGGLALLGWLAFQTQQLLGERQALQAAYTSQQQTVDNAGKLRGSLDALAADTQRMADGGNPNARLLVDELRKRGITINTANTPTAPTTSR